MITKLKTLLVKIWSLTIVKRTVHTFWQAFLAVFVVGIPLVTSATSTGGIKAGEKAIISLLTAAVAAGLAALKAAVINYRNSKLA